MTGKGHCTHLTVTAFAVFDTVCSALSAVLASADLEMSVFEESLVFELACLGGWSLVERFGAAVGLDRCLSTC